MIVQNPAELTEKPKRAKSVPVLWTAEQAGAFVDAARPTKNYRLYALLIGTGLRLGEALPLQWNDVDLRSGLLVVRGGKTESARRAVLMPEELTRELRKVRGVGLVFNRNGKPLSQWTVRDQWYTLLESLELPRIRLHDLRHLHRTLLLANGIDLATVSARLGHSSKAFTPSTYIRALASGQERAAQAANQLLT